MPFVWAAVLLLVTGCLPGALQDDTPDVAVIGVPADERLPGAADGLHARLTDAPTGFDLVPTATLRFLEVRSGLVGSRVTSGAARVARSTGADVAVTIGAAVLERELTGSEGRPRQRVELRMEAYLIRAADAEVLARLQGPTLSGERNLEEHDLPPIGQDHLLADLIEESLDPLAEAVGRALRDRADAFSGSSGG